MFNSDSHKFDIDDTKVFTESKLCAAMDKFMREENAGPNLRYVQDAVLTDTCKLHLSKISLNGGNALKYAGYALDERRLEIRLERMSEPGTPAGQPGP